MNAPIWNCGGCQIAILIQPSNGKCPACGGRLLEQVIEGKERQVRQRRENIRRGNAFLANTWQSLRMSMEQREATKKFAAFVKANPGA